MVEQNKMSGKNKTGRVRSENGRLIGLGNTRYMSIKRSIDAFNVITFLGIKCAAPSTDKR